MSGALTIQLLPHAEQTEFNLKRWDELIADPQLARLDERIETDRHGQIIMSPPPAPSHGSKQSKIGQLLWNQMPAGSAITECGISTADGVKVADIAWASPEQLADLGNRSCFLHAPKICVEVISPSNSAAEIREKTALYFDAGAQEVWHCSTDGQMTFFGSGIQTIPRSVLCPEFPDRITLT